MNMGVERITSACSRFLQIYEKVNTYIISTNMIKKDSFDVDKKLFEIIYTLLLEKFLEIKNLKPSDVLPKDLVFDINIDFNIKEIYTSELLAKFDFSLEEIFSNKTEDYVTPLIFSHLFEYSRLAKEKQKQGIFYTSNTLVDFMCKETITTYLQQNTNLAIDQILSLLWNDDYDQIHSNQLVLLKNILSEIKIIDPACGSGAFLLGSCNLISNILSTLERKTTNLLDFLEICSLFISKNIHGFDIDREAINISKLRLILYQVGKCNGTNDLEKITKESNFVQTDSLLYSEETIKTYPFVNKKYDIIIGNPPFIRQELFSPQEKLPNNIPFETNKLYKENILFSLERYFKNTIAIPQYMKGDFYIYFYYRGLSLLKENGVLCYITSNSWLDAKFGLVFQEFLLQNYHLKFVYTNLINKSFSASVNTAITVITNTSLESKAFEEYTRFVAFNNHLENVLTKENLLLVHKHTEQEALPSFNIHSILQTKILELGVKDDGKFKGIKLGTLFLRAPLIYHEIMELLQDKITTLGQLGKIRYPLKTGINDFFYLTDDIVQQFAIEKEYLIPVVKSPKKIKTMTIKEQEISVKLFVCRESRKTLKEKKKTGALSYIEWGAQQKTDIKQQSTKGVPWPDIPSVQFHKPEWYSVRMVKLADIFCNRFIDRRFFFCKSNFDVIEDQTFYGLVISNEKHDKMLIHALLNSTLSYFFLELFGRSSLGRGALQYSIYDYNNLPVVNPSTIPKNLRKLLLEKFINLKSREISSIFDEVKRKDRREFDRLLFEWIGFTDKEIEQFYDSFTQLVKQRLTKSGQKFL